MCISEKFDVIKYSLGPEEKYPGESDGGGGELDGGGCESMYSIFGNESFSGCHGGLWWLIEDEEDGEVVICIWRNLLEENSLAME
nr:hypothetical protein [Tanacetum cinerariifolium]